MNGIAPAFVLCLAVVVATFAPAQAGGITRLTGRLVDAQFVSQQDCAVVTTELFAVDDGVAAVTFAQYVEQDACTGALLAFGTAGGPLDAGQLVIDPSLRRATLRAAVNGIRHDGSPLTLAIHLDWDVSSPPLIAVTGSHIRSPGSTLGLHTLGRAYEADVAGAVLDGARNLADASTARGRVALDSSATLVMETRLATALLLAAGPVQENDHVVFDDFGAVFSATDASGCVFSQVFLSGYDGKRQTPGGPARQESLLGLFAFAVDNCQNRMLLDGYAERPLAPGEFTVSRTLADGHLGGVIEIADRVSGGPVSVPFDVTWTAVGAATMSVTHDLQTQPFTMHHAIATSQPAIAAGVFPGLLEGTTQGAGLSHLQAGEVSHER